MVDAGEVTIDVDASELEHDLDRIDRGELRPPTVSSVTLLINETELEDVPIYIGDCDAGS